MGLIPVIVVVVDGDDICNPNAVYAFKAYDALIF